MKSSEKMEIEKNKSKKNRARAGIPRKKVKNSPKEKEEIYLPERDPSEKDSEESLPSDLEDFDIQELKLMKENQELQRDKKELCIIKEKFQSPVAKGSDIER